MVDEPENQLQVTARSPGQTILDWIETWYNPSRRHAYNRGYSPADYEALNTPAATAA